MKFRVGLGPVSVRIPWGWILAVPAAVVFLAGPFWFALAPDLWVLKVRLLLTFFGV